MTIPLKILHTESSCGWGGQEIRILNEIKGMMERGHTIELITPAEAEIYDAALSLGITTHALPISRKKLSSLFKLKQWLRHNHHRFDVINTHSSTDSWLVALANLKQKKPIVRTRHVSTPINQSKATKWLYHSASNYIVTTGEALRQQLHNENGLDLDKMCSVPTGVNFDIFSSIPLTTARKSLNLDQEAFIFGIVATLRDWKGHSYLFEAYNEFIKTHPNTQLIVVGDGPHQRVLEKQLQDLNIKNKVTFVGRQQNINLWVNAFNVFCLPSYGEEGVPQALMQAMAVGCAVISTPVGAIREIVKHEETGLIVPPKDIKSLYEAMTRLYKDPAERKKLGDEASVHIHKNYGLESMLDQMELIFHKVIG